MKATFIALLAFSLCLPILAQDKLKPISLRKPKASVVGMMAWEGKKRVFLEIKVPGREATPIYHALMESESANGFKILSIDPGKGEVKLDIKGQVVSSVVPKGADCPVDNVSEPDARQFCIRLSEIANVEARLPTEAEWEYASRAGRSTKWFFGDDPSKIGDYAWYKDNGGAKSHPVGQKKPNPWGFHDIYGNVCERISDKYHKNYYSVSPAKDPTGPRQATKSRFEYTISVPQAGKYALTAQVVTVNYDQWLKVSANEKADVAMPMPFTEGEWQDSKPVELTLQKGENTLRLWRDAPPQKGLAIKKFTLSPVE